MIRKCFKLSLSGNKVAISGGKWFFIVTVSLKAGEVMLIGEFSHSIDEKGRVRIPKNFRDELGETFYITKGFEECLFVFPEEQWLEFMAKLKNNNFKDEKIRRMQRFFTGSAMPINLDGQGRTVISQALRKFAQLEKEVSLVGMDNRIEIWSTDRWNEYNGEVSDISVMANESETFTI